MVAVNDANAALVLGGGLGGSESGGTTSYLPMEAQTVALTAWVLGTVVMFGSKAWYRRQF